MPDQTNDTPRPTATNDDNQYSLTRTIHAVASPLDRLMALMEGKTPPR